MKKRILSLILCIAMCMSVVGILASCGGTETPGSSANTPGGNTDNTGLPANKDAFVIMSEELDGLFNPFYSTTGADSTIVSMTQIGMLSSKYVNGSVEVAFGEKRLKVKVTDIKDTTKKNDAQTMYEVVPE